MDSTFDFATGAIGSSIDFIRSTGRFTYYIPIGHEPAPGHPDRRTLLALGARAGIIHSLDGNGTVPAEIPIDEPRGVLGARRRVRRELNEPRNRRHACAIDQE